MSVSRARRSVGSQSIRDDEEALTAAIVRLATQVRPLRLSADSRSCFCDEGWRVNLKRVYRIWRREGLKVPRNNPNAAASG